MDTSRAHPASTPSPGDPPAPTRATPQLRQIGATAAAGSLLAVATGVVAGLGWEQWLVFGLAASVVVWVGGAISGQLILARLLDTAGGSEVLTYLRQLLWIIPRIYVPAGFLALACGLGLAARTDVAFTSAQVVVPVALYTMTAVAGAAISAPGYVRLVRLADRAGPDHPDIRRRLQPLAWLNRVELTLVLSVGFVLIASVA